MKTKREPERTCLGCGEKFLKKQLVRIVRQADAALSIDRTGKKPGRGAYICPSAECLEKLRGNRRLSRQFEMQIPDELYAVLEKELKQNDT